MQWDKNLYILFYVHNFRKGLPVIGCHVPTSVGGYGVPGGGVKLDGVKIFGSKFVQNLGPNYSPPFKGVSGVSQYL